MTKKEGRPFKMAKWLVALKEVLALETAVFLTDKELLFLVNDKLEPADRITKQTFINWKNGKFHEDGEVGQEFLHLIEGAIIRQKMAIGDRLLNDPTGHWTRLAWLLERKFSEFNLKHITENVNRNEQSTVIHITAGNEEQRKLIDNIINAEIIEYKEVPPKQLAANNEKEEEYDF